MTKQVTLETNTGSLSKVVARIAAVLSSNSFPTGERAALKRLDPNGQPNLVFYRFAFRHLPEGWEFQTTAWMTLVAGIALMYPNPHRIDRPAGQAMAESGYSEARLERLLAARGSTLQTLLLRSVRYLAAKSASCNWTDFARLLLSIDPKKQQAVRLTIARAFYHNLKEKE